MPDIAARPGSRALAGSLTPDRPTPVRPRRSCSAVTRERPTRATRRSLRCPCGRRERRTGRCPSPTSATDPPHEHPRNRWTPRLLRLAAPSARVEIRLTPSSSFGRPRDALPMVRRGEERRISGPALRRGRPVQPPSTLGARPLTLPVTARTTPREAGPPGQPRTASAAPSSKSTTSAARSAFRRRSLPRRPLAQVAGELPSASAITTVPEHDQRTARDPARLAGGCPPARRSVRATTRLAARSGSSNPGPGAGGGLSARQRLPGDPSPGSFAPDPICPDTSCHAPAPTPAGVARRRPRARQQTAPERRPRQGCFPPPPREEGRGPHTRGAFHREASRRRPLVFHRLSPACGFLGAAPLWPSRSPRINMREVPP